MVLAPAEDSSAEGNCSQSVDMLPELGSSTFWPNAGRQKRTTPTSLVKRIDVPTTFEPDIEPRTFLTTITEETLAFGFKLPSAGPH